MKHSRRWRLHIGEAKSLNHHSGQKWAIQAIFFAKYPCYIRLAQQKLVSTPRGHLQSSQGRHLWDLWHSPEMRSSSRLKWGAAYFNWISLPVRGGASKSRYREPMMIIRNFYYKISSIMSKLPQAKLKLFTCGRMVWFGPADWQNLNWSFHRDWPGLLGLVWHDVLQFVHRVYFGCCRLLLNAQTDQMYVL